MWKNTYKPMESSNQGDGHRSPLRILTCTWGNSPASITTAEYAQQLADLVQGELHTLPLQEPTFHGATRAFIEHVSPIYDLIALGESGDATAHSAETIVSATLSKSAASLLAVRIPVWPLRRILLLVRGEATDAATVEWGIRLAQRSDSTITLLVVLPAPLSGSAQQACDLSDLVAGHSLPGKYVRTVLKELVDAGVNTTLKLNPGSPTRQVRQEVMQEMYDLIIISAEPPGRLLEKRLEPLIAPLLRWTERPLLIARPQQVDHETVELAQGERKCY